MTHPDQAVMDIQRFLNVHQDLTVLRAAFDREVAPGPADYKIEHTASVHANSIGHGKRVPVTMLPPPLLTAINEKLEALGYPVLDRSWNTAERAVPVHEDTIWSRQLRQFIENSTPQKHETQIGPFALIAEDHPSLRWIFDIESGTITQGDGDVEAVVTGTAEDLVLMLNGDENLGALLRSGRIRYLVADEEVASGRVLQREIATLAALIRESMPVDTNTKRPV